MYQSNPLVDGFRAVQGTVLDSARAPPSEEVADLMVSHCMELLQRNALLLTGQANEAEEGDGECRAGWILFVTWHSQAAAFEANYFLGP